MTGVSIIVPVYNALDEAKACIESLYSAGSLSPFEVIVIDNGSHSRGSRLACGSATAAP